MPLLRVALLVVIAALAVSGTRVGGRAPAPPPAPPGTGPASPVPSGGPLVFSVTDVNLPAAPRLLRAFDADGDGAPELAVLMTGYEIFALHVTVLDNDGSGGFTPGFESPHPENDYAEGPAWLDSADLDLDGTVDVTVTPGGFDHSVRLGDGHGRLDTFMESGWFGGYAGPGETHDIDSDGVPDHAHFTADFGAYIDWGQGEADGMFDGAGFWVANPYDGSTLIRFGDLDGDADQDVVLSTASGVYVGLEASTVSQVLAGAYRGIELADLDGDTDLDLVFTEPLADRLGVLLGDGDGTFGSPAWFDTGRRPDQLALADLDGDGELDAVTGNCEQGSISILLGDGNGSFGAKQDVPTGPAPLGLVAVDLDLDGDTDIAVCDAGATTVTVLLQQTPSPVPGGGR